MMKNNNNCTQRIITILIKLSSLSIFIRKTRLSYKKSFQNRLINSETFPLKQKLLKILKMSLNPILSQKQSKKDICLDQYLILSFPIKERVNILQYTPL